jgi:biotin carboxyl carrier protein
LRYEVEIGGRRLRISVAREGNEFAVTVDGLIWQVDAARLDAHTLSLVLGRHLSAEAQTSVRMSKELFVMTDPATGQLAVSVGVVPVIVSLNSRRRGRRDEAGPSGMGPQRITAPMPGKVTRVLVKTGDAVRARQPIVVVEAMKMENELRAGRDGTVTEVHARDGISVDAGAVLVVIQ